MDSLLNASSRVALAGLVRGLGKFARRAEADSSGAYDVIRSVAPNMTKEAYPFAAPGGAPGETLLDAAAHEALAQTFLESVFAAAERAASGFEREEFDKTRTEPPAGRNYRSVRLRSLFEEVSIGKSRRPLTAAALTRAYPLKPLTPASLFPVPLAEAEPKKDAAAVKEYAELWNAFRRAAGPEGEPIPAAFGASWPLWLDAFDTLWLTYTQAVPFFTDYETKPDVSLYDHSKTTAALAAALWRWQEAKGAVDAAAGERLRSGAEDDERKFLLIQGDFFGIQDFIFSEGSETNKNSAKVLRGRSFYVSLVCELAALKVLEALSLPSTNLIINAAGKFMIVAPNTDETVGTVERLGREFNDWFVKNTFATCGVGLAMTPASLSDFIEKRYEDLAKTLFENMEAAKFRRFNLTERRDPVLTADFSHGVCKWQAKLPADGRADGGSCAISRDQIRIGRALTQYAYLLVLKEGGDQPAVSGCEFCEMPVFGYRVAFAEDPRRLKNLDALVRSGALLRCWDFSLPDSKDEVLWHGFARRAINGYVPRFDHYDLQGVWADAAGVHEGDLKTFEDLAGADRRDGRGVKALMTLKGDVDNLGRIFLEGLVTKDRKHTLNFAKTAELSRKMNGFFSTWLPRLCADEFRNVYTVFAGGDDFFMIGPWHEMQRLARRLEEDFKKNVAENPEVHFSAGLVMAKPAVPARTFLQLAEEAIDAAKGAGKNRLSVFGGIVEWKDVAGLVELEDYFARAVTDCGVTTSYLYGLFEILDMAADHANPAAAMWRSRLYYNTTRLFERDAKRRSADAGQARDEFLQTLVRAIDKNEAALRIPLTNVFYSIREGK